MGGLSIYERVHGVLARSHHGIEGWNLGGDVCYVLEEGAERLLVQIRSSGRNTYYGLPFPRGPMITSRVTT